MRGAGRSSLVPPVVPPSRRDLRCATWPRHALLFTPASSPRPRHGGHTLKANGRPLSEVYPPTADVRAPFLSEWDVHGRLPGRFLEVFPRCAQVFPAWSDYEDSGTVVRRGPTVSILLCDVVICAAFGVWWRGRAAAFRRGRGLRSSGGRVVGYNGSTARAPPALWHPIPALQPLTPFNLSTYDASSTGPPNGLAQNSGAQSPFFLRADASTELVDATLLYPRACPDSAATLAVRMLPLSLGEVG
jgi:hypothetical protein